MTAALTKADLASSMITGILLSPEKGKRTKRWLEGEVYRIPEADFLARHIGNLVSYRKEIPYLLVASTAFAGFGLAYYSVGSPTDCYALFAAALIPFAKACYRAGQCHATASILKEKLTHVKEPIQLK